MRYDEFRKRFNSSVRKPQQPPQPQQAEGNDDLPF